MTNGYQETSNRRRIPGKPGCDCISRTTGPRRYLPVDRTAVGLQLIDIALLTLTAICGLGVVAWFIL